jgi:hypothetical protein
MTNFSRATGRKADFAIGFFKLLMAIACLSLLVVFLDVEIGPRRVINNLDFWLWACNGVMIILYLAAGGFFMVWFYAFYKQLYLGSPHSLRIPPVWTVLGFSFPLANLFLPYVLVVNTWRRLRELNASAVEDFTVVGSPRYFKVWWFSHLVCFFSVPGAYIFVLTKMHGRESEIAQIGLSVFAYTMVCVSAFFAIRLVRELKSYWLRV